MDRFDQLCSRFLDGLATAEETGELASWLRSHPEHARDFRESFQLDQLLRVLHTPARAQVIDAIIAQLQQEADPFVESVARELPPQCSPNVETRSKRIGLEARLSEVMIPRSPAFGRSGSMNNAGRVIAERQPCKRVRWLAFAASATLLLSLGIWFFGATMGEPVLAEVRGLEVTIKRGAEFLPARPGTPLLRGDVLRTGTSGVLHLAFGEERTLLHLADNSELRIDSFALGKRLVLQSGRLTNHVARQRPFQPMILRTPHAEARVLGTEFTLDVTAQSSQLDVTEGAVLLTRASDGLSTKVKAGQRAKASAGVELRTLPRPGGLLREYWTNILGDHPTQLARHPAYPSHPDGSEVLTNFVVRTDWGEHFGDHIRGYVHPPVTGKYTFWISGNPNSTLNLSRNEKPEECVQLAITEGGAGGGEPLDWDSHAVQRSSPITLVAGRRYYIEVIRKTNLGRDHLAVAWQPPGEQREIIRGEFLSPWSTGK